MPRIHVVPDGDEWAIKHEGDDKPVSQHTTQEEAETVAKAHAREHGDPEVVIHGNDGRIRDSDTMDPAHESGVHDEVR